MYKLSHCVSDILRSLGADHAKLVQIGINNATLLRCVKKLWPDPAAHNFILEHINAFYIRKDERPRKGPDKDKPYIVAEVVIDDPMVRAEIDMRRELLVYLLMCEGLIFKELRIIPARRSMKNRHPYLEDLTPMPAI
jgi:hypothetical protein